MAPREAPGGERKSNEAAQSNARGFACCRRGSALLSAPQFGGRTQLYPLARRSSLLGRRALLGAASANRGRSALALGVARPFFRRQALPRLLRGQARRLARLKSFPSGKTRMPSMDQRNAPPLS